MHRYFKLVCLWKERQSWLEEELRSGRIRFGWSPRESDLREIKKKVDASDQISQQQAVTWRYSQFLINRISNESRVIIQFEQPLRNFFIAEINGPYDYSGKEVDFNHILPCKLLAPESIDIYSSIISHALRHDLSKRGHYYEIYSDRSRNELEEIIKDEKWKSDQYRIKQSDELELAKTSEEILDKTAKSISEKWKAKDFEKFIHHLLAHIEGIEVKNRGDEKKGWDLKIQIIDPLTGLVIADDIPVQCKNFTGEVMAEKPIEDLERSIRNSESNIAYLFIMGVISAEYQKKIDKKAEELSKEFGRKIIFYVVDQERIAELYLSSKMITDSNLDF